MSNLCSVTVDTLFWGNRATCVYTVGKSNTLAAIPADPHISGRNLVVTPPADPGRPKQMTQEETGLFPFLLLTALLMPTPRKSAPFGLDVTRGRSRPSSQAALVVKVIHKIAELELELLNIVRDHYGLELPTVTPMCFSVQGAGGSPQTAETCKPPPELDNYCEGPGQSVRKLSRKPLS